LLPLQVTNDKGQMTVVPDVAFSQQVIHTAYAHQSMSNFVKFESESIKQRQISAKAIKKHPVLPCPS
jgi:hypothetical protein